MSEALTAPKMSLLDIENWLADLIALREQAEDDGELPETLAVIDQQIQEAFTREVQKVDGIAHARMVYELAAEQAKKEADRLYDRAKRFLATVERIDNATIAAMKAHGKKKLETPYNTIRYQNNGGLEPLDIPEWPKDASGNFKPLKEPLVGCQVPTRSVVTWTPDTAKIRDALKQRVTCPECKGCGEITDGNPSVDVIVKACPRCKGEGTIPATVPGAKLLPRGEQLRVL